MKKMKKIRIVTKYNADIEEPKCIRCDYVLAGQHFCDECINNFWCHYERTEINEIEVEESKEI